MSRPLQHQGIENPTHVFPSAYLVLSDFDETGYETFEEDSKRGIYGVGEAYRSSIVEVFDHDADALKKYIDMGEHQNRPPSEIVHLLTPNGTPAGLLRLTKELNRAKLAILEKQIGKPLADGTPWPRPVPGFVETWTAISAARQAGVPINTGFISSGHASFIRKCLESTGLEYPDIMVTDETILGLNSIQPPQALAKPSIFPLSQAVIQWANLYGTLGTTDINSPDLKQRMCFIGDSAEKDGGLAANGGIKYFHVDGSNEGGWFELAEHLQLGSAAVQDAVKVD